MAGTARIAPSVVVYGLSILMTKGFALVSMPLVTAYLAPAEFGELDLANSVIEFIGLFAGFGLAETLYRFAGIGDVAARRAETARIAGAAVVAALLLGVALQLLAPALLDGFGLTLALPALRAALAAAALSGLIELPLAWLRLNDRPLAYLGFVAARTIVQIALIWMLLANGFGAEGVFYSTAIVHAAAAALMLGLVVRANGLAFGAEAFRRLGVYGLPLVGAGLAMFALGSADRWFLAPVIGRDELAHYAVAVKLSLATALVVQPLLLWWAPQRLAVLAAPGGVERNRRVWLVGFAVLAAGASGVVQAMPVFVDSALPASYAPALAFLPALVVASALNELASLSNAGVYLGRSSWRVLAVNASAASVALTGYALFAPVHGAAGAIGATIAAQACRVAAFAWLSRASAPVPLVSMKSLLLTMAAALPPLVTIGAGLPQRLAAIALTPALVLATALALGVVSMPAGKFRAARA